MPLFGKTEEYFYQAARYVERSALRANLVRRAEEWRWGSLWHRRRGGRREASWLSDWPKPMPSDWLTLVNQPKTDSKLKAIYRSVAWSQPYGSDAWVRATAQHLGLGSTLRARGRPRESQ